MGAIDPKLLQRLDDLTTVASRYGVGARALEVDAEMSVAMAAGIKHANLLVMVKGKPTVALVHPAWYEAARELVNVVMLMRGELEDAE